MSMAALASMYRKTKNQFQRATRLALIGSVLGDQNAVAQIRWELCVGALTEIVNRDINHILARIHSLKEFA
jgi:hypothetical protein